MGRNRSKLGNKKYNQGKYVLTNSDKYLGDPTNVSYRSSWEFFFFCRFCDLNDKVMKWSCESIEIPYHITNDIGQTEVHRYYPDFYIEMTKNGDPEFYDRVVIELKPKTETNPPKKPKNRTMKTLESYEYSLRTYKKNLHKWAYAKEWCERRNMKFVIITEDDLISKGLLPKKPSRRKQI